MNSTAAAKAEVLTIESASARLTAPVANFLVFIVIKILSLNR